MNLRWTGDSCAKLLRMSILALRGINDGVRACEIVTNLLESQNIESIS